MANPEHTFKGLSPLEALDELLMRYERNPKPWVAPSWREPRQTILSTLLSNPITAEQAQALETVSGDLNELQTLIDWLSNHADEPWRQYWKQVQQKRSEDRQRARAEELARAKQRRIDELKEGTPLRLAASVGQVEQVVSLIREGADVNAVDDAGRSPIYLAALRGHANVVQILLSKGASAHGTLVRVPPLHGAAYCGHVDVATMLLAQGTTIKGTYRDGTTALHQAAMGGQAEMISFLAHHGADLIAESDYGTPMTVALHWNRPECVQALAALGAPIDPIGQLRIPRHFFISFSQKNRRTAADLGKKLEDRKVPVWIASDDLMPGMPDWEAAVREAIGESFAVLFLASPDSRESLYVRGELKVAETKGVEVIPLWIDGDKWVDSVPLDMTYGQYIDFREASRSESLNSLVPRLLSLIDEATPPHFRVMPFWRVNSPDPRTASSRRTGLAQGGTRTEVQAPPGFLSIALTAEPALQQDGGIAAFFNLAKYTCVHAFLDDLYTNYLRSRFKPFSYGKEWVLAEAVPWDLDDPFGPSDHGRCILAPWSALVGAGQRDEDWLLHTSLPDTGLEPGSLWFVEESLPTCMVGVAVKDKRVSRVLQEGGKKSWSLWSDGIVRKVPVSHLGDRLPFRYVVGLYQTNASEEPHLIIQTDQPISEAKLAYYDRR